MNKSNIEKEQNFVSAVIYVRNDQNHIGDFLVALNSVLSTRFEHYEMICVNDDSYDDSVEVIRNTARSLRGGVISLLNMSYYQGTEAAMNAGVDLAIGDFVYEFDECIIDYEPSLINELYERSLSGFDIVAASPNGSRVSSRFFYRLFNRYANYQYKLGTERFRLLSRRAINRIHSMSRAIPYRKALYANCGLKMDTIKYKRTGAKRTERRRSDQRMKTALDSLIIFTDVGYKMATLLTSVMMAASLAEIIYTLAIYLLGKPVEGFTTTMLVLTLGLFAVFAILSIVIKYLSVLVELIYHEQKYIVESIEKLVNDDEQN